MTSGEYVITFQNGAKTFKAYCDMDFDEGQYLW